MHRLGVYISAHFLLIQNKSRRRSKTWSVSEEASRPEGRETVNGRPRLESRKGGNNGGEEKFVVDDADDGGAGEGVATGL